MIELIEKRARVFRVGSMDTAQGLWYDHEGQETGLIHKLEDAQAASLPMGPHPYFRAFNSRWISVTDNLADLTNWFSCRDCARLIDAGYQLLEYDVERYARFHFTEYGYQHEVFRMADLISMRPLNFPAWLDERMRAARSAA